MSINKKLEKDGKKTTKIEGSALDFYIIEKRFWIGDKHLSPKSRYYCVIASLQNGAAEPARPALVAPVPAPMGQENPA